MLPDNLNRKARLEKRERELDRILDGLSTLRDPEELRARRESEEQLARERAKISRVFVGNLSHTVTHKMLARIFNICGPISQLNIGCFTYHPDSTLFAEIEFNEPTAHVAAAYLNGLLLEGRAIVVCRKMADLPENRRHSKQQLKGKGEVEKQVNCHGTMD